MRKVIIAFFFTNLYSPVTSSAQSKKELDLFLSDNSISKAAKDYYQGKFKATDNAKTFSILDSMETNNVHARPFYLYLATQMMKSSDGTLSEELGLRAKVYLEQHPNWALEFLQGRKADPAFMTVWGETIAGEIMIDCEGEEKKCAKDWYSKALKYTRNQYKQALTNLYRQVAANCP